MDIVVQILGAQKQPTTIAIPQVTDDGFEESDFEGLTGIIDTDTARQLSPRIGESARREAEAKRIRKAVEEDMVPDSADGHVRRRQRPGRQRMGEAGHQSGKGAGGSVLRGGQHAVDFAMPEGIEGAIATELTVALLQEPEQSPWIVAEHGKEAGQGREELPTFQDLPSGIPNAPLGRFEAEDLVALPLQSNALLGHAEQIGDVGRVQHLRVGEQFLFDGRPAPARHGQRFGQGSVGAAAAQ
jgi:hypothetical protein